MTKRYVINKLVSMNIKPGDAVISAMHSPFIFNSYSNLIVSDRNIYTKPGFMSIYNKRLNRWCRKST